MNLTLVNQSKIPMPRKWLDECADFISKELKKELKVKTDLTIVFLDPRPAKKINFQFRKKNYATDVLSFPSEFPGELGELILCPQVLKRQAKEHDLSFKAELAYMLIHGVLHLLGWDHERSTKEATQMFRIQDQIFDRLCAKFDI